MTEAREILASLKALHGHMAAGGLVVALAFPWSAGEVIEFGAERTEHHLGLRDLWWLSSLPEAHRAGAMELLRSGARVESLSVARPSLPTAPSKEARPYE